MCILVQVMEIVIEHTNIYLRALGKKKVGKVITVLYLDALEIQMLNELMLNFISFESYMKIIFSGKSFNFLII